MPCERGKVTWFFFFCVANGYMWNLTIGRVKFKPPKGFCKIPETNQIKSDDVDSIEFQETEPIKQRQDS